MNNILNKIIKDKKIEVDNKKEIFSLSFIKNSPLYKRNTISLKSKIESSKSGIIAEFKRRSPSKKNINSNLSIQTVTKGYEKSGACGMSILTDNKYFGGSLEDLIQARSNSNLPLLRKEFIIDKYQIFESKAFGADIILLIASILSNKQIIEFSSIAKSLGLEVLIEVQNENEINKSTNPNIDFIGVNNRDLKTFNVSLDKSKMLSSKIPDNYLKISESGIKSAEDIKVLKSFGFKGFLIGENFMKSNSPDIELNNFIKNLE
jgi:indole-3-glycerol phosphate synthase